ncbi:hypothetical protein M2171_004720 [Bradyrhizobium japonicum USDA 38]|uniref:hypothetical protein n=1 Tax=Bradyrhizobium japonicum TaxID=375 RepID=UPI0006762918|nr:hypothetical protein [Bradyrhizobium japonicum]MCS3895587.1 hypothetical protein [Bradyrhizobium japonicum USDA 38]MCS3948102.1 hypothetical protein [Bradyrhizobium japonicum]
MRHPRNSKGGWRPTPGEKQPTADEETKAKEKQQAENMMHPKNTIEMHEETLVVLAWLSKVDGTPALEQFERCERLLEVAKRAEALLASKGIHGYDDYIKYQNKKARLWAAYMASLNV